MIEFEFWQALVAGSIGAVAMTAMMQMSKAMGMTKMPGMDLVQGAMVTDDPQKAKVIGKFTHLIVMGTVVFGLTYAALFTAFDSTTWWVGALIGGVHGVVSGVFMTMMGNTHPRMESAAAFTGEAVEVRGGQLRIAEPGFFAKNWGGATPMGIVVGHVIYGLVVALVYGALV